jgi:hypothetical protein
MPAQSASSGANAGRASQQQSASAGRAQQSSQSKSGKAAKATSASGAGAGGGRAGVTTPYRISSDEALDNTRRLLAEKKARARKTPAWQAHDDIHPPGHVPAPGFEAGSARDRAEDLHEGEMRLNAREGAISDQDRVSQGKRDSR